MTPVCIGLASGIVKLLSDGVARGVVAPSEIIASLGRAMDYHVIDPSLFRQLGLDPALLARCQRENPKGPVCKYLETGIVQLLARGVASGVIPAESIVSALSIGFRQGLLSPRSLKAIGLQPATLTRCETAPGPGPGVARSIDAANQPFGGSNLRHL